MCYCWCTNKLKTMNYKASRVWNKQTLQFITGRINIGREESVALFSPEQWPSWCYDIVWICWLKRKEFLRCLPLTNMGLMKRLVRWGVASSVLLSSCVSACVVFTFIRVFLCDFWRFWSSELSLLPTPSCLLLVIKLHLLFSLFSWGDPHLQKWYFVLLRHRQRLPSNTAVH